MWKWENDIHTQSEYKALVLHGTQKERKLLFQEKADFYIINYEALTPFLADLQKKQFKMIIADESARYIQTNTSKRSKSAIDLGLRSDYNLILSGTLISKKPLNVWSQFMFLDGGRSFGNNFYRFRGKYFHKLELAYGDKWILKKEYINYFNEVIYKSCIKITREETSLDFPKVTNDVIKVKMSPSLESLYEDVYENIMSEIETSSGTTKVDTKHIFQKLIRLQQITSGFISSKDDGDMALSDTPKLDRLTEDTQAILEDEESIIVWCRFRFSIKMISERFKKEKIKFITLSGEDSSKSKNEKWQKFQNSKTTNVFVGQVEAGGIGIELFKKHNTKEHTQHSYIYERTWEFDDTKQAKGRSNRIGQLASCRFVDMVMENTIDERIFATQQTDKDLAELILRNGARNILGRRYK